MLTNATAQSKADSKTTGAVVPLNEAVHERLHDAETALGLKPIPGSIYARLKAIEQRLAYLETVSPEYCHFVVSFVSSCTKMPCHNATNLTQTLHSI